MTTTDQLAAIQARYEAAQQALANDQRIVSIRQLHRLSESANDVPALLALVWEQQARIERVRELHQPEPCDPGCCDGELCSGCLNDYPCPTIAALTATEGAE